jgi:hypothetical protein
MFHDEQAAWPQQPGRHSDDSPRCVQAIRSTAVECGVWVVVGHLRVDRIGLCRDVRRVGDHDIRLTHEIGQHLCVGPHHVPHPQIHATSGQRLDVAFGPGERVRFPFERHHPRTGGPQ